MVVWDVYDAFITSEGGRPGRKVVHDDWDVYYSEGESLNNL